MPIEPALALGRGLVLLHQPHRYPIIRAGTGRDTNRLYTQSWNVVRPASAPDIISTNSPKIFVATCGGVTVRHIIPDHYPFLNRGGIFVRGAGGGACGRA